MSGTFHSCEKKVLEAATKNKDKELEKKRSSCCLFMAGRRPEAWRTVQPLPALACVPVMWLLRGPGTDITPESCNDKGWAWELDSSLSKADGPYCSLREQKAGSEIACLPASLHQVRRTCLAHLHPCWLPYGQFSCN